MKEHKLKCWPDPFKAIVTGKKRVELRLNDRNFQEGDMLFLMEYIPDKDIYTGSAAWCSITNITEGFGLKDGYVALSIDVIKTDAPDAVDRGYVYGVSIHLPALEKPFGPTRYFVTCDTQEPFVTDYFDKENMFNPEVGMVVYDLHSLKYTDDGDNWKDVQIDHL